MRSLFKNLFNSPMRSPTAEESYAFKLHLTPGALPYDEATNVPASCSISGVRYGLVKGVFSSFASNMPPVEDKGLRGCPAFTQKNLYSYAYSNWLKGSNVVLSDGLDSPIQPGIKSAKYNLVADTLRIIATSTITENANGKTYRISFWIKAIVDTTIITEFRSSSGAQYSPSTSLLVSDGWKRLSVMYTYASDMTNHFVYIYDNSGGVGDRFYITDINYTEGISLLPSVPTNGSSISVVSEAATSTTGTSFDLDDAKLIKFKEGLRGKAVGANLWTTPGLSTPPWTDNGTHYVCDGTVNYGIVNSACVQTGKFYEIEFTTGSVTTNGLVVYIGAQIVFNGTLSANTKYVLRNSSVTTGVNVAFSSGAGFVGQIRKDIVVKEVQAQGHIELEFESNVDSEWLPSGVSTLLNMFSVANNQVFGSLYFQKDPSGVLFCKLYDGTKNPYVTIRPLTVGQTFKISLDYGTYTDGSQKMCLTVNGVKSIVVAFSGSFGAQDLRFFFGNTVHAGWIKNLSYSEKPVW